VCVEYFTVGHPSLLGTRDPTVLGFAWGIIATWWVGLPLGVLLALVARLGPWPSLTIRDVWRPILTLMLGVGLTTVHAGLVGYILARSGDASIPHYYAASVPQVRQALFVADAWAHENAYTVGTVGGVVVACGCGAGGDAPRSGKCGAGCYAYCSRLGTRRRDLASSHVS
jgi:hypothetical protein